MPCFSFLGPRNLSSNNYKLAWSLTTAWLLLLLVFKEAIGRALGSSIEELILEDDGDDEEGDGLGATVVLPLVGTLFIIGGCLYILTGSNDDSSSSSATRHGNAFRNRQNSVCRPLSVASFLACAGVTSRVLRDYKENVGSGNLRQHQSEISSGASLVGQTAARPAGEAVEQKDLFRGISAFVLPAACLGSWLCFKLLPMCFPKLFSVVSPASTALRSEDLFSTTSAPNFWRLSGHAFFLSQTSPVFYWLIVAPLVLYVLGVFAEKAVGSGAQTLQLTFLAWIGSSATALILRRCCSWATPNSPHWGCEALMFSIAAFIFIANPRVHTQAFQSPRLRLPFPVELRWPMCVMMFGVYLSSTALAKIEADILSGLITGALLALFFNGTTSAMEKFASFFADSSSIWITIWLTVLMTSVTYLPFSASRVPSFSELVSNPLRWTNINWLRATFHPSKTLSNICMRAHGLLGFLAARLLRFYMPLVLASGCADLLYWTAALLALNLTIGMSTLNWIYPNIGFAGSILMLYKLVTLPAWLASQ